MTDQSTLRARKEQLTERRLELMARMSFVDQELSSPGSPDWEENAVEHEEDETLNALGQSAQAELRMIAAALARLEQGEYGFCTICGAEISAARLDLLPATPFCKRCAR
ncbi:TraR/DksA family transcriptional regulator [Roseinatronobacter alkalisoli]|uniref:TraR/DksA C4-type zinc finger protein n=1 Tax=Roseinatronobacter alkalisoli TaxID=3028235 RepID=A0ABT5TGJ9_9RHOB|nr:TraR/DksA C4-type zinc finger protein [Roseinatronobacter sp. HJB301]MDD7973307.1 TraR/DksA C4-type zinc finger protein [Roseinatronobacter sp. HJB301]